MQRICGALMALVVISAPACKQAPVSGEKAAPAARSGAKAAAKEAPLVEAARPAPKAAVGETPVALAEVPVATGAPAWAPEHPQPVRQADLFSALKLARVSGDEVADIVVACKATAKGRFDHWSRPDLTLKVTLPGGAKVSARGPEDRNTTYVTLRLGRLKKGDKMLISAYDRDTAGSDHVGSRDLTYAGEFPLEGAGPHLEVTCRAVDKQGVQVLLKDEEKIARGLLSGARATLKPKPGARAWGFDETVLPDLRDQIAGEAALAGWSDPLVAKHLGQLAALQASWDSLAAASVAKVAAALPAKDQVVKLKAGGLGARVSDFVCEDEVGCVVKLWAKNQGDKKLRCSAVTSWLGKVRRQALVRADGSMLRLQIRGCMSLKDGGKVSRLEPGDEVIVLLGIKDKKKAKGLQAGQFKLLWLADFMVRKSTLLRL